MWNFDDWVSFSFFFSLFEFLSLFIYLLSEFSFDCVIRKKGEKKILDSEERNHRQREMNTGCVRKSLSLSLLCFNIVPIFLAEIIWQQN